ncbi:DUF1102 family [Halapricum desulfuricans]|uniref:DUF1102 family n=2 Tax=Halapricum desulfuricans TaxID=2841257 RepID=A0A897NKD4_9EURY|nr:DUF1102 family [Halapricum desulfuricans]
MNLDLSSTNDNVGGSGVNTEALSVFHNVFEICNLGSQSVCVDFAADVPVIPNGADVPDRYGFEDGDLAVVFYRGANRSAQINVDNLDTDRLGAFPLDVGDCQCIGFEVRAFGFDTGEDLFADTDLAITAKAGSSCANEPVDPVEGEDPLLRKTYASSVVDSETDLGTKKNGNPLDSSRADPTAALGKENGEFVSLGRKGLGRKGQLVVKFEDELVKRPFNTDVLNVETTNGRDGYPEEKALIEVAGPGTGRSYEEVGVATSKATNGTNTFELPAAPITKVRLTDQTEWSKHSGNADGFDVDAVGGWTETST